ncbi:MAG: type II toxin-antitoxin system RelE/ParE family toxin [Micrococcaceae bacterium]
MAYKVKVDLAFNKDLKKLDKPVKLKILNYLEALEELDNPRSKGKALTGNKRGFWRYRVADYRRYFYTRI